MNISQPNLRSEKFDDAAAAADDDDNNNNNNNNNLSFGRNFCKIAEALKSEPTKGLYNT